MMKLKKKNKNCFSGKLRIEKIAEIARKEMILGVPAAEEEPTP